MVSKRTEELVKWDAEHIIHPFTAVGQNAGLVFEKGHGIWIQDTEGKEYIVASVPTIYGLDGLMQRPLSVPRS